MKTKTVCLCDKCGAEVERPEDGFVLQGNIYAPVPETSGQVYGGLIGSTLPDNTLFKDVEKACWCKACFFKAMRWEDVRIRKPLFPDVEEK